MQNRNAGRCRTRVRSHCAWIRFADKASVARRTFLSGESGFDGRLVIPRDNTIANDGDGHHPKTERDQLIIGAAVLFDVLRREDRPFS